MKSITWDEKNGIGSIISSSSVKARLKRGLNKLSPTRYIELWKVNKPRKAQKRIWEKLNNQELYSMTFLL